jgi:TrmH family RNA methyltransferase
MIESVNNERIIKYAKLEDKKYRDEMGLFIVEGKHLVEEAIKKNIAKEVFTLDDNIFKGTLVSYEVMKKLSSLTNPPNVLAVCEKQDNSEIEGNIIILDDLSNPGNLGTIIRSAVAFNYKTIILSPNSVDIYNPKVIRSTEGMLFNVNIIIDDISKVIPKLKQDNYLILGTDVNGGELPSELKNKHALIIGSEGHGMNKDILKLCDKKLYIKMNPLCESLNAGVSASILMYEINKGNI